jgi:hypothetical protein
MQVFDAPEREFCVVRRTNTNTPLQALVLLNDVQMVEAARKLADRMLTEGGKSLQDRLAYAYRLVLGRRPSRDEMDILCRTWQEEHAELAMDLTAAKRFSTIGESPGNPTLDPIELGTYAQVARLILNLDETITKN